MSKRLAELGAVVSHSDDLARYLLENDVAILAQLSARFGTDILDDSGKLRRSVLAERAFSTKEDQLFLNQLIHPKVWEATQKRLETARERGAYMFVMDAPLLFEAGVEVYTDSVLVVTADALLRKARIFSRSQILAEDFDRRESLQMPIDKKIELADHIIENNGTLEDLYLQVDELYHRLTI
ncbi:MAG: dephospho-CoA kinase [Candidatus Marinimicrobia bacterium]|nr:dephospho-CoA kinase [Candidatus Neomarinimicrobiota bacterium]MCF7851252.1 dephospho-CoA kinase [Candidatus Neomarinimicrobiota bacterium]